jgi:hypothetical protein
LLGGAYDKLVAYHSPHVNPNKGRERGILRGLKLPRGARRDATTYDPSSWTAVRSWLVAPGADACAQTETVLRDAFGPRFQTLEPGPTVSCEWWGSYQGLPWAAYMMPGPTGSSTFYANVEVKPLQ